MSVKKLHRIYFGFDGKPDPYKGYLKTWTEQLGDYEICHWNADNLPIDICAYSRMMFELKDYAFLSDYFRWWVLREHGGIYLDADIEIVNGNLLNKIVTEFEENPEAHAFLGIDNKDGGWYTAHSVGCKKGSKLAEFMCEVYENLGPIAFWRRKIFHMMAPQLTALYFAQHGFNMKDGMGNYPMLKEPTVLHGVKIYPQEWFSPMTPIAKNGVGHFIIDSYTQNTCICHHFSCSWHDDSSIYKRKGLEVENNLLLAELAEIQKEKNRLIHTVPRKLISILKRIVRKASRVPLFIIRAYKEG